MAALYVPISLSVLEWLIHKAEVSGNTSAYDLLKKWRYGKKQATFHQIEELSKKMQIPLGYFFLQKPPIETCPLTEFRTVDSVDNGGEPSANLVDTFDMMIDVQDWMRDYVKDMGQEKKAYVASCNEKMSVTAISETIRRDLHLVEDWMCQQKSAKESFNFLRHRCQNEGILIMMNGVVGSNTHRPLNLQEFRAFTLVDDYVPLIFINAQDSHSGRLFSLLHEIAHIWIGINSIYNDNLANIENTVSPKEQLCNAVASELLVPVHIFQKAWNENQESLLERINHLSRTFTCSSVVIARKALDAKYIPEDEYHKITALAIKNYKAMQDKKKSGGNYYNTMASRLDANFVYAITESAKAGRTQYSDIYRLTNTNRTTFKEIYQRLLAGEGGVKE